MESVQISNEFNEISPQCFQHCVVSRMLTESKEMLSKKLKKHISRDIWNIRKQVLKNFIDVISHGCRKHLKYGWDYQSNALQQAF